MTARLRHQPLARWMHALWAMAVLADLGLGFLCLGGLLWSGLGYELRVHAAIGLVALGAFLIYLPYRARFPAPDYNEGPLPFAGLVRFVHRGADGGCHPGGGQRVHDAVAIGHAGGNPWPG